MASEFVTSWEDEDFRPAPPGWRVVTFDKDANLFSVAMPGWLVQVEERVRRSSGRPDDDRPRSERGRRVVASVLSDAEVWSVESWAVFLEGGCRLWGVLAPDEEDPTSTRVFAELESLTRRVRRG